MDDIVQRIDSEIEKMSLLKHPFYRMWSEGKLTTDHLQGYSKEYFQLVKIIPQLVQRIAKDTVKNSDGDDSNNSSTTIANNAREEAEHVELWIRFATALGLSRSDILNYGGSEKTNEAITKLMTTVVNFTVEEAVAALYAYEMELPKISRSKIDGLKKFYGIDSEDGTKYFEVHEEVDVRHAQLWREILQEIPSKKHEVALKAAIESLVAQNLLLDSVHKNYVGSMCG